MKIIGKDASKWRNMELLVKFTEQFGKVYGTITPFTCKQLITSTFCAAS